MSLHCSCLVGRTTTLSSWILPLSSASSIVGPSEVDERWHGKKFFDDWLEYLITPHTLRALWTSSLQKNVLPCLISLRGCSGFSVDEAAAAVGSTGSDVRLLKKAFVKGISYLHSSASSISCIILFIYSSVRSNSRWRTANFLYA